MSRIDAVVFDLFETLITEFDPDWQPGPSPASRLGIPDAIWIQVWRSRKIERMTSGLRYRDVLREGCTVAGIVIDTKITEIIEALHAERLATKAKPTIAADARICDMLAQLRASGLKLGVLSNCAIEEVAAWGDSPLAPFFDDVVFSYRVGYAKPDPKIYQQSCEGLDVAPENVIFVGDGGSDELFGARDAGMITYRARWFLDQWPAEVLNCWVDRSSGFPALQSPADLLAALTATQDGRSLR